jgi:plasmid stabilization system protein ParE
MDRSIRWTESAVENLNEVAKFVAKDSPYFAASFVREVRESAHSINVFPERGRIVPEIDSSGIYKKLQTNIQGHDS